MPGGASNEAPRFSPALAPDLKALGDAGEDACKDWRKAEPAEIARRFDLPPGPERAALSSMVFVGTAQALARGSYWAPCFGSDGAVEVDVSHLSRPISALHLVNDKPPEASMTVKSASGKPTITCWSNCNPLDAAARLSTDAWGNHSVAVVRFTGMRDLRNEVASHSHLKEDQLFLRTTYSSAFEKMGRDIAAPIGESIDQGCVIATSGVGVLRGPIERGAVWFQEPPKIDVFWIGIEPRVQFGAEEDYANFEDMNSTLRALDRAFGWAVAHGCDAVVLPPIGCDVHGCRHPRLDVADAIFQTAQRYGRYIPHVCVASDAAVHCQDEWWQPFAEACQGGRPPLEAISGVPPIALPPYRLVPKDAKALAEKQSKLSARRQPDRGAHRGSQLAIK